MRLTFTGLQSLSHKYMQTASDSGELDQFIKDQINATYTYIASELKNYKTQITKETNTVVNQQYYHYPNGIVNIESCLIQLGTNAVKINLRPLDSQQKWNEFNAIQFQNVVYPQYFFPRQDDFGIWPIPQVVYPMTLVFNPRRVDLTSEDYTTGTLTATNGSTSIVGSGTTWTSDMVGRWIQIGSIKPSWYRIAAFTSTTALTLDNYFEGSTASSLTYKIGDSPELPEEVHDLIAARVAEMYFGGLRGDVAKAAYWGNYFNTGRFNDPDKKQENTIGGFIGAIKRYASRSDSAIVERNPSRFDNYGMKVWGYSITP